MSCVTPPAERVPCFVRVCLILGFGVAFCHASLTNRWSFNNAAGAAATGTTMTDSVGGGVAQVKGNGSTFSGTALTLTGSTTGNRSRNFISGYVDLPNGLISSKTNLSVEIWATPLSAQNYSRLFDFGRTTSTTGFGAGSVAGEINNVVGTTPGATTASDNLMLSFSVGTNLGQQRMEALLNAGSASTVNTTLATTAGTQYHYLFTFEDGVGSFGSSGGRMSWYRNGTLIGTGDVGFHLSSLEDVNNWLGRSMWSTDNNTNAAYNELRIYNHVLSTLEIAANIAAGPDVVPPPPTLDPAPTPSHLWVFNNQADSEVSSGTIFSDSVSGLPAVLRGNGATLTGTSLTLPGSTNGNQSAASISAYLDLPNGLVSAQPSISIEAWATPLSSKNWQRLFDFGRSNTTSGNGAAQGEIIDSATAPGAYSGYDNVSLTINNAGTLGSHQLEGQINGGAAVYNFSTAATTIGTQYHYVLVVQDGVGTYGASGCQARWYRNGVYQNSLDLNLRLTSMSDVNNWIGRSQYGADSNSNLSLNELRFYNRALSAGEILSSFTAGPDPISGPPEPPAPAPLPLNRWKFNNAAGAVASGTAFTDSISGKTATLLGNGATLNGTAIVLPGTTNGNQTAAAISAYLDLPNGIVSSKTSMTFETWVRPISSKTWQRIFDFGSANLTSGAGASVGEILDGAAAPGGFIAYDNLLLSLNNNGVFGSHRLEGKLAGTVTGTVDTDLSTATTANTEYHYVMTVEDGAGAYGSNGARAKWYRNGTVQGSLDLSYRLRDMSDVNNWIGRSQWAADMNSNMAINELRIYDRAITPAEVLTTYNAGANTVYPTPVANPDAAKIHPGQKVLVEVLANDSGLVNQGSVEIVAPPATGTASVSSDGRILYQHSGIDNAPVVFTYRVFGEAGVSSSATVTISIESALRLSNPALAMPAAPPMNAWQLVDALPGLTFNQPVCISSIPGNTTRLFVCERMAKIRHVPDVTSATPTQNVFLDLQTAIAGRTPVETIEGGGNGEHGLLGLAFHPNYASNGYFYVAYTVRISGGSYYQRISRFKVSAGDPTVADPASELILLQQLDEGANHDGGDLHFGADGYLYYTAGDEENPNDFRLNSQKINKDFFCGIFRFDVDKKPGNLAPNPHISIPTDGGVARFSVPIDNPFVHTSLGGNWDGTYNGVAVTPLSGVRSEFWATGLRHVWRFSFDSLTGEMWGGDVGQDTYEEINKIVKGGNYGWVYREGKHDTAFTNPVPPTKPAGFTSIDPIYEYVHAAIAGGDASFKGNSVVGGYVYRGSRYPSLVGTYIFSDSVSGHVWQMDTTTGATTRLTGLPGAYGVFSTQGVDPSNKDLLFGAYLTGKIMRLSTGSTVNDGFPTTLSATGLFSDLTDLSPAPGMLPYQPNLTFWSDHAIKRRWFTIPDPAAKMTWNAEGNWTYPTGTVWVKHFDLELSRGNPATAKRIETRVLVKTATGSYGVSYRWNDAQTEATLVDDAGLEFDVAIDDHGTAHTQRWQIPGRSSCLTCHTPQAGHALSFNTRQLNRNGSINGFSGNQLTLLSSGGFLNGPAPSVASLARHVRPDETQYPLELRARSYLAVNCAYCHQAGGSVGGFWDGRAQLKLEDTGLIHGVAENNGGNPLNKYIVPGDTGHSIVLNRMAATNGFNRMPPLGSTEVDPVDVQLITDWINSELATRPIYDTWRSSHFAALDPAGDRTADPDSDGLDNYREYLLGSSPLTGSGAWQAQVQNGTSPKLRFLKRAHRFYSIETSETLGTWSAWTPAGMPAGYSAQDEWIELPISPPPSGKQFFRFQVSEP